MGGFENVLSKGLKFGRGLFDNFGDDYFGEVHLKFMVFGNLLKFIFGFGFIRFCGCLVLVQSSISFHDCDIEIIFNIPAVGEVDSFVDIGF